MHLVCFHFENVTAELEGERKMSEEATAPQPGRKSAATIRIRCAAERGCGGGVAVWVKLLCFGGLAGCGVLFSPASGNEPVSPAEWRNGSPPAAPAFCLSSVSRGCPCLDNAWNICGHTCSRALARAR